MKDKSPYYSRYDIRYRQVRKFGLEAFKGKGCIKIDISLLDLFLKWHKDIISAKRVIEFGCGDGYLAVHMAKKGYSVVAFDYSKAAIEGCIKLAKKNKVKVNFRTGNALDIKWAKSNSFDFGVTNNVLQMFATNKDRNRFVSEIYRVLKPGGFLFLNCPAGLEVPEKMSSVKELRKWREFYCDLKGKVKIKGKEKEVTWPHVASWGPNVYSAGSYFRKKGFHLRYIHWEHNKGYGRGLTMYLEKGK
jgi:2-polyprenyl-3-methyl-5-hydroxy-6-metoxy-1,4-benzoquinol methylase